MRELKTKSVELAYDWYKIQLLVQRNNNSTKEKKCVKKCKNKDKKELKPPDTEHDCVTVVFRLRKLKINTCKPGNIVLLYVRRYLLDTKMHVNVLRVSKPFRTRILLFSKNTVYIVWKTNAKIKLTAFAFAHENLSSTRKRMRNLRKTCKYTKLVVCVEHSISVYDEITCQSFWKKEFYRILLFIRHGTDAF